MPVIEVILGGVILGGLYALVAIGFNLQYGMARIVNLAYGEFLMGAALAAFWMYTLLSINPIVGMLFSVPVTFGANWLIYRVLMLPLVRRARTRNELEGLSLIHIYPSEIFRRHVPVHDDVGGNGLHVAPATLQAIVFHQPARTADLDQGVHRFA